MSVKIPLMSYEPKEDDKIFFDTNVWLYLFCSIGNYKSEIIEKYSTVFYKILKSGCRIYTTSLVISEFFNTYCRIDFKIKQKENKDKYKEYKCDFRNTEEFNILIEDICDIINNKIFKYAQKLDDNFNSVDMSKILVADKNFDFNDKYIAQLCQDNNIKIITNDKDFLKLSNKVEIITN